MPRASLLGGAVVGVQAFVAALVPGIALAAEARAPGDAIRLVWREGDVAGHTAILAPGDAATIGIVEYHQRIDGDVLEATRVSRFADGSADEDVATARIDGVLEAIGGRSIVRAPDGRAVVDVRIDVPRGRLTGFFEDAGGRHDVDETVALPPGTYWGPLVFLVVKNFAANAADGRVRFRTVVPTPRPRVLTMELVRQGARRLTRMGTAVDVEEYRLRPTLGWLVDPIVQRLVPTTTFLVEPTRPPSLAEYAGPRNYTGQEIRLP